MSCKHEENEEQDDDLDGDEDEYENEDDNGDDDVIEDLNDSDKNLQENLRNVSVQLVKKATRKNEKNKINLFSNTELKGKKILRS